MERKASVFAVALDGRGKRLLSLVSPWGTLGIAFDEVWCGLSCCVSAAILNLARIASRTSSDVVTLREFPVVVV